MQIDKSREKSLYFLLLAVARQMNFRSPDKSLLREAINNIKITESDDKWEISTHVYEKRNTISTPKSEFSFYQTRSLEIGGIDPVVKNKESARKALIQLFKPFNFEIDITNVSEKQNTNGLQTFLGLLFFIIATIPIYLADIEAANKITLFIILIISFIHRKKRFTRNYLFFLVLLCCILFFIYRSSNISYQLIILSFVSFLYIGIKRVLTKVGLRIFGFLTITSVVLFSFEFNENERYLIILICFLMLNEVISEFASKWRRELMLVLVNLGGILTIIFVGVYYGDLTIAKLLLGIGFEIYLVFFGKAQSISRFLLPPALLLTL